jgi:Type II secretion system (T2SS), protein G
MAEPKNNLSFILWSILGLIACGGACLWITSTSMLNGNGTSRAKMDIKSLETSITTYWTKHGEYPKALDDLLKNDPSDNSPAPLTEKGLLDPWGNRYIYEPTKLRPTNGKPLIWSKGKPGENKPIKNWEVDDNR